MISLYDLPIEIIDMIIKFDLTANVYKNLRQTCKKYYDLTENNNYVHLKKIVYIEIFVNYFYNNIQNYFNIKNKFLNHENIKEHIKNELLTLMNSEYINIDYEILIDDIFIRTDLPNFDTFPCDSSNCDCFEVSPDEIKKIGKFISRYLLKSKKSE